VWGSGCGVQGVGFRVWGSGCGVLGVGFWVWGSGCGVWGLGKGVEDRLAVLENAPRRDREQSDVPQWIRQHPEWIN